MQKKAPQPNLLSLRLEVDAGMRTRSSPNVVSMKKSSAPVPKHRGEVDKGVGVGSARYGIRAVLDQDAQITNRNRPQGTVDRPHCS